MSDTPTEPTGSPPPGDGPREGLPEATPRRGVWPRRVFLAGSSLLALCVALWLTRAHTLAPLLVQLARRQAAAQGLELSIHRISGSWWSDVRIEGLELRRIEGESPLVSLRASRIESSHSLPELLRGEAGLHSLTARVEELELQLADDPAAEPRDQLELESLLTGVPALDLTLDRVTVRDAAGTTTEGGARARLDGGPGTSERPLQVSVAELQHDGRALGAVRLLARLTQGGVEEGQLTWRRGENSLEATDILVPWDVRGLDELRRVEATLALELGQVPALLARDEDEVPASGARSAAALARTRSVLRELRAARVELQARLADARLDVEVFELETEQGRCELHAGHMAWTGAGPSLALDEVAVDIGIDLDFPDIGELQRLVDAIGSGVTGAQARLRGSARGSGRVSGTLAAPRGQLDVRADELLLPHLPRINSLRAQVGADRESVRVRQLSITSEVLDAAGAGTYDLAQGTLEDCMLTAEAPDLGALLAELAPDQAARWAGSLRATLSASGAPAAPVVSGRIESESLRLDEQVVQGLVLDGEWSAAGLRVEELSGAWREVAFEASGGLHHTEPAPAEGAWRLDLASLELDQAEHHLELASPTTLHLGEEEWRLEDTVLGGALGELKLRGTRTASLTRLELAAQRLDPMPLIKPFLPPDTSVGLLEGEALLEILGDSVSGSARLAADVRSEREDIDLEGRVNLTTALEGTLAAPGATLELTLHPLSFSLGSTRGEVVDGGGTLELALALGEALEVTRGELDLGPLGRGILGGRLEPPDPSWLRAPAELLSAPLRDTRFEVEVADVEWLSTLVPGLRYAEGSLRWITTLDGTLENPRPRGRAQLALDAVRFEGPWRTGGLTGELLLAPQRIELANLATDLGGGPLSVSGSVLTGSAGRELDLELVGTDVLLLREDGFLLRADARLAVEGPVESVHLSGELALADARFSRRTDPLGWLQGSQRPRAGDGGVRVSLAREGALAAMTIDVALAGGEPFVIDGNLMRAELKPDLRLEGTGELATLVGRVFVDQGQLSLPSGTLRLDAGLITFDQVNPFHPRLELSGGLRVKGHDIRVAIEGTTAAPEVTLVSTPPLANEDLFVLLFTGELPEGTWRTRGERAGRAVAIYLVRDALSRWLSQDQDADESLLDRLEIAVGDDISRSGVETLAIAWRLSGEERRLGRQDYLTAERDLFDKVNYGYRILLRFE